MLNHFGRENTIPNSKASSAFTLNILLDVKVNVVFVKALQRNASLLVTLDFIVNFTLRTFHPN